MIRAAAVALVLVVAACAAGCTGSTSSSQSSPAGGSSASASVAHPGSTPPTVPVVPPGSAPRSLPGFYAQRLAWVPCDKGFECSRLYVPADYAHPDGPAFVLPVVKLPAASPAERIGSLVINPGGPGGSGLEYALGAKSGEFTQEVLDRFDIVGFDPRGVGGSDPALHCLTGPQLDKYLAVNESPTGAAQLAAVVAANKAYAQDCDRNDRALLPYLGTAAAARDLDVLRAALGDSRLTYLGKSYGTVLGASYAQQFPSRVRALVLDGAVAPQLGGVDLDIAQASGFEVAFGQFAAWCATRSGCPLPSGSSGSSAAVSKVSGLLAAANAHPLSSVLGGGQPANGAMLLLGVASALYSRSTWPILRDALSQAFRYGDGTLLVELADSLVGRNPNGTYSNLSDVGTAVDCVDRTWPTSLAAWQAAASAAAKVAPLFGPTLVWGSLPCAYWPIPATPVLAGASSSASGSGPGGGSRTDGSGAGGSGTGGSGTGSAASPGSAAPVLVVGDLHDPATPYAWAGALARWLGPAGVRGVLLGWNGEGHTSYMEGDSCVDAAVDAYLIHLQPPQNGTVCQ